MNKIIVLHTTILILFCGIASSFGQTVSEEAKRHFDRGMAAVEMAKTAEDYAPAIKEFEQAAKLAPDWPDIYYNLGKVQEKAEKYSDAITNLKQYLRLAPNASDAETVKTLINKLEYRAEKQAKVSDLGGTWKNKDTGNEYQIAVTRGNLFEAVNKNGWKIRGVMKGLSFVGIITIPGERVSDGDGCVTPNQDLECTITIGDDNNTITVNYTFFDFTWEERPPGLFNRRTCRNFQKKESHPDILVLVR
jgi:hypothetical protein